MDDLNELPAAETHSSRTSAHLVVPSILSAFMPGAGQLVRGEIALGLGFLGLFLVTIVCFALLRMGTSAISFFSLIVLLLVLGLVSSVMALVAARKGRWKFVWLLLVIPAAVVSTSFWSNMLLRQSGLHAYSLGSSSMENTIYKGESVVVDEKAYLNRQPERGEVIAFSHKDVILIKRLIGLPGDNVSGRNGTVFVNGTALAETYANFASDVEPRWNSFSQVIIPAGSMFVLGDNRNYSLDSRMDEFGGAALRDLIGRPIYVIRSGHGPAGRAIR